MKLTLVSLALGTAASIGLARWMSTLLFAVGAIDPWSLVAMAVVIAGAVALAGYLPARRAAKVDPIVGLRHQ